MIKIGICDEDVIFTNKLHETIGNILFPIDEWTTQIFHTSDEIIEAIETQKFDCQLLFMDIMIGEGLNTVRYIFEHEVNTDIIFITSSKDYVYESYHYHTFAYLLKPVSETDISVELQRYLKELNVSPRFLSIISGGAKHNIPIHSILYIESNRHKVIVHTIKQDYICYQKLSELEDLLKNDGFLLFHMSKYKTGKFLSAAATSQFCRRRYLWIIRIRTQRLAPSAKSRKTMVLLSVHRGHILVPSFTSARSRKS